MGKFFFSSIFILVFFNKKIFTQHSVSQISVLGSYTMPIQKFANKNLESTDAYFANNGLAAGLRYTFFLLTKKHTLYSGENFNLFSAYCPGDFEFLNGYPEVEFFGEYQYTQNNLSTDIEKYYQLHYNVNTTITNLGSWSQHTAGLGLKFKYTKEAIIKYSLYGIVGLGGGVLITPTYSIKLQDAGTEANYTNLGSFARLAYYSLGGGVEVLLTPRTLLFMEAKIYTGFSDNYKNQVQGKNDESLLEYSTNAQVELAQFSVGVTKVLN